MNKKPLDPTDYGEEWLISAWGEHGNLRLLEQEIITPRPRVVRALELAEFGSQQRVLDIACGRGEIPALASERGAFAVGIDFSAAVLEFAGLLRDHRRDLGAGENMVLVRADACRLPFSSGSFDRITMLDIIEHLVPEQLEAMFLEVHRLLSPNGYAIIHTLPNRWVYDITFPFLHRLMRRFPKDPRGPHDRAVHVNEQDLPRLHQMVRRCGLQHHLWLEQHMPAQARWNAGQDQYGDNRDTIYPMLSGIIGRLLELASRSPMKTLLSNDIFGILWKGKKPLLKTRLPLALTERLVCRLADWFATH